MSARRHRDGHNGGPRAAGITRVTRAAGAAPVTRAAGAARAARATLAALALLTALAGVTPEAAAEYGDVVLNNSAEKAGVRPVVFPHWFHRIRFRCKVCHSELGFKMRAGSNNVLMADIVAGRFCGMCHNSQVAWGAENCDLCHSGKPGLKSGIYGSHETRGPGKW